MRAVDEPKFVMPTKQPSKTKAEATSKAAAGKKPTTKKVLKDPAGGLTEAGREHFKETEGANLKPGVKGPADTPEKMKRKGSFLRRHFANPNAGPLEDKKGEPTRHALSAQAWGEPLPKTSADVKKLADKGSKLLEEYHESTDTKEKKKALAKKSATAKSTPTAAKKPGVKKTKAQD